MDGMTDQPTSKKKVSVNFNCLRSFCVYSFMNWLTIMQTRSTNWNGTKKYFIGVDIIDTTECE